MKRPPSLLPDLRRRSFLGIGLGIYGLGSVNGVIAATAQKAAAKSVLVLFEQGGMSQMDTWDPKPDVPAEHRSPFRPIDTVVPGLQFTELLEQTARHADKLSVVRCMHQPEPNIGNSHPRGCQYVFSGEAPGSAVEMPDIGSVVVASLGGLKPHLPPYLIAPGTSIYNTQSHVGFLPAAYEAFKVGGRDLTDPKWTVPNLSLLADIDIRRFKSREDLLSNLDVGVVSQTATKDAATMKSLFRQAEEMLTNPSTRNAFDLQSEPLRLRERYGKSHRGQCYLLGRKLIEAGARFVTIDVQEPPGRYEGAVTLEWDHHANIYSKTHTNRIPSTGGFGRWGIGTWPMMGSTDKALSALLHDMDQRGLLDETLVCFVTEFGRTPKINERSGRDHWTHSFTYVFAGAGVPGGQSVGETDRDGGYITSSNAYTIEDYAATIHAKVGTDVSQPIRTSDGRPVFISAKGQPIPELFS
ncbi:MAG: DUF1501 domain-containing protein [Planctomycetaceae bacterium]